METPRELVDIHTVSVDTSLPRAQRIVDYVRQIKDPYHFIAGGINVTAVYDPNGPSFEDCLRSLME